MRKFKWINSDGYKDLETGERLRWTEIKQLEYCMLDHLDEIHYIRYGESHREDGPAIITYYDQSQEEVTNVEFWLQGECYKPEKWLRRISKESRIKYLFNMECV